MRNNGIIPFIIKCIVILIGSVILGSILVIGAYAIPNNLVEQNIEHSLEILKKESPDGGWTEVFTHGWAGNLDAGTDEKIFSDANVDPENGLLRSAFGTYARMWNGYMVLVRPLLMLFSYGQIRFIFYIAIAFMTWYICIMLKDRLGIGVSFAYVASLLMVNIILVPYNIVISVFILAMSAINIWVLKKYRGDVPLYELGTVFFVSGITDIFFDMFTAPLVVLCMPLLILLFIDIRNENLNIKQNVIKIIFCSVMWFSGYVLFWGLKWILSTVFTGENIVSDALNTIFFRAGGQTGQKSGPLYSIFKNVAAIIPTDGKNIGGVIFLFIISGLLLVMFFAKNKPKKIDVKKYTPCYIVMLFPFVWYAVVSNHSIIHATIYSYRLMMIPIFGFLSVLFIETRKPKENRNEEK